MPQVILNREFYVTSKMSQLAKERGGTPVKIKPAKFDERDWGGGQAQRALLMRLAVQEVRRGALVLRCGALRKEPGRSGGMGGVGRFGGRCSCCGARTLHEGALCPVSGPA